MTERNAELRDIAERDYQYGFTTDIEVDQLPPGLDENVVRTISAKKREPEWLLEFRLKALHRFFELLEEAREPTWAEIDYPEIDYQDIVYYSAPKKKPELQSLDEVDPELRRTYDKLGIPLQEQERLAGVKPRVAVDAVFDSVSVATTYKAELEKQGIVFGSFADAVEEARIFDGDGRLRGEGDQRLDLVARIGLAKPLVPDVQQAEQLVAADESDRQ